MRTKLFTFFFLAVLAFYTSYSFAQRPIDTNACYVVTAANVMSCCSAVNYQQNAQSCRDYEQSPEATCAIVTDATFPTCCGVQTYNQNAIACQAYENAQSQLPGGTQGTNPQNSGAPTTGTIGTTPQSSSAALKSCSAIRFDSLLDILIWLKCIIGAAIIPLIFTVAFFLFLRGVLKFMANADNKEKRDDSKRLMIYSIIGLVVMTGVWGIVQIINTTFGFGNTVPQLQTDCLTTDKNNPCK